MRRHDCSRVNAWMSVTVLFKQSECFGMSGIECCGRVPRAHRIESRECRIVDVLVENLRAL